MEPEPEPPQEEDEEPEETASPGEIDSSEEPAELEPEQEQEEEEVKVDAAEGLLDYLSGLTEFLPDDVRTTYEDSEMSLRMEALRSKLKGEGGLHAIAERMKRERLNQNSIEQATTQADNHSTQPPDEKKAPRQPSQTSFPSQAAQTASQGAASQETSQTPAQQPTSRRHFQEPSHGDSQGDSQGSSPKPAQQPSRSTPKETSRPAPTHTSPSHNTDSHVTAEEQQGLFNKKNRIYPGQIESTFGYLESLTEEHPNKKIGVALKKKMHDIIEKLRGS